MPTPRYIRVLVGAVLSVAPLHVHGVEDFQICPTAGIWVTPTMATGIASASVHDTAFNPAGKSYAYLAQGHSLIAFRNVPEDGFAAGTRRWISNWSTPGIAPPISSSPAVFRPSLASPASELIFVGADDGFLYKINPDTNPPSTMGSIDTRRKSGGVTVCAGDRVTATPAVQLYSASNPDFKNAAAIAGHVSDDLIFVITNNGCSDHTRNRIFAYWASDLSLKWSFNADFSLQVDSGYGGCFVDYATNTLFCGTDLQSDAIAQNSLFAIDTITGNVKWAANAGAILNRPLLHQGRLYVARKPGSLLPYNPAGDGLGNGSPYWAAPVNVATPGTILVSNISAFANSLFVLDSGGRLAKVNDTGSSGSIVWTQQAEPGATWIGAPVLVPTVGKAYLGRDDGYVQQIQLQDGNLEWLVPVGDVSVPVDVYDPSPDTEGPVNFTNRLAAAAGSNMARFKVPFCPPNVSLTVSRNGLGSGTVTTTDGVINCGATCTATYPQYSWATLQASPDSYSGFGSWSGGTCNGSTNALCTIVMDTSKSGSASFTTLPRTLVSAAIRKTHGAAGPFDFPLAIGGGASVEPRAGTSLQVFFTFDGPIVSTNPSSGCSNGTMTYLAPTGSNSIGVDVAGVQDGLLGTCQVVLNGSTTQATVSFATLAGDVNGSLSITASDILRVKGRRTQAATGANFAHDTNISGAIDDADVDAVKGRSGVSIP
jgi:hypothetical protein